MKPLSNAERAAFALVRGNRFAVARADGAFRLVAETDLAAGDPVFEIEGRETAVPSFRSVQIGAGLHIDTAPGVTITDEMDLYPWRFLNHSCAPSCRIDGRSVIAERDLQAGDELTFNYNTTEAKMAEPFACACASPACAGTIAGYHAASPQEKVRLSGLVADYLG